MADDGPDPNKVYTISMSTVIKMECDDCEKAKFIQEKGKVAMPRDIYIFSVLTQFCKNS